MFYADLIRKTEDFVAAYFENRSPSELYNPAFQAYSNGGKRIRPALVFLGNEICNGASDDALHAAVAIEMFHNFTLVHDDIMDNAPKRRNSDTVWKEHGINTAILSGDALMVAAYDVLQRSSNAAELIFSLTKAAMQVCEGQQLDMNFERRNDVSIDEYLEMIKLKTSVLLAASLKMGAISARASVQTQEALYEIALQYGIGFQLHDDILDVFGNPEKFGKQLGGDILANKKTFLLLKALELAQGDLLEDLMYHINSADFNPQEKVDAVKNIYDKLSVKVLAERKMNEFYAKGSSLLEKLELPENSKRKLSDFFSLIINRDK